MQKSQGLRHILYLAATVLPVLFTSPIARADNLEYADCLTNFSVLEQAVLEVKDNRYNMIKAFYSPNSSYPAVYVKLTYTCLDDDNVTENWLWTKAPFYFIQPPTVFQFTSLLFNYHSISQQTTNLHVDLPAACCNSTAKSCYNVESDTNSTHVNNKYLDVLTNELYLYAQNNGRNTRIVLDDTPSTSLRYNRHCSHVNTTSFYFFNAFCLLLPFFLLLFGVVILQSCQTRIRPLLASSPDRTGGNTPSPPPSNPPPKDKIQPSNEHGYNQDYAALILTGMVFSGFVLVCDGFTLYQVFVKDDLKFLEDIYGIHAYYFSRVTIAIILTIDGLAMLFSGLNFFVISCLSHEYCQWCTRCSFSCFIFMYFCRHLVHDTNPRNKTDDTSKQHQEYRLWLLLASFTAPLVCMGTHSSFVIMAWTSDSEQANSMTVVFVLSFIYYYLGFRQLYIIFAQGCCVTFDRHLANCAWAKDRSKVYEQLTSDGESSYYCCCLNFSLDDEINLYHKKLERLNFKVLVCEFIFLLPLLMSVEALVVLAYYLLPVPATTVPSNVLSIFHLMILIGTGLIAYKFLKTNVPKSGSPRAQ